MIFKLINRNINLQLFAEGETLKDLLGDELYKQVTEKLGDKKIDIVSNGNWIPKEKFDQVNEDKKAYKKQVDDLNNDLGKLKNQLKDNEEAQKTIKTLQDTIKDNEDKIKEIQKEAAIKIAIKDANAKDPIDILPHLKKDIIEIGEDGTVKGLEEQLKTLKESKGYLFKEEGPNGTGGSKGGGPKVPNESSQDSTDDFMKAIYENQAKRN